MSRKKDKRLGNLIITEFFLAEIIIDFENYIVLSVTKNDFAIVESFKDSKDTLVKLTR